MTYAVLYDSSKVDHSLSDPQQKAWSVIERDEYNWDKFYIYLTDLDKSKADDLVEALNK